MVKKIHKNAKALQANEVNILWQNTIPTNTQ